MPPICASDPAGNLERVQQMGHELEGNDTHLDAKAMRSTEDTDQVEDDGEGGRISRDESRKLNKMSFMELEWKTLETSFDCVTAYT